MISENLKPAIKKFLEQVDQTLSCNGCNDWDFTVEQQREIIKMFNIDVKDEDAMCGLNTDYTVLRIIQKELGL